MGSSFATERPFQGDEKSGGVLYLSLNVSQNYADTSTMEDLKKIMIKKAKDRYKKIHPCGRRRKLAECFTLEHDKLCFWFNTDDQSTHVLHSRM